MDEIKPITITTEDEFGNKIELTDRIFKINYKLNGVDKCAYFYETYLLMLDLDEDEYKYVEDNKFNINAYVEIMKKRLEKGFINKLN